MVLGEDARLDRRPLGLARTATPDPAVPSVCRQGRGATLLHDVPDVSDVVAVRVAGRGVVAIRIERLAVIGPLPPAVCAADEGHPAIFLRITVGGHRRPPHRTFAVAI